MLKVSVLAIYQLFIIFAGCQVKIWSCPPRSAEQKKKKLVKPRNRCLIWPKLPKAYTNSPSLPTRAGVIKNKTEIKSSRTSKITLTNTALIGQRDLVLNQRYIIRCRNVVLLCEEGDARIKRLEREGESEKTNENTIKWKQMAFRTRPAQGQHPPSPLLPSLLSSLYTTR